MTECEVMGIRSQEDSPFHLFCQYRRVTHSGLNHWKSPYLWARPTRNGSSRFNGMHTPPKQIIILIALFVAGKQGKRTVV